MRVVIIIAFIILCPVALYAYGMESAERTRRTSKEIGKCANWSCTGN